MKATIAALALALCLINGAFAARSLSQLPVLGSPATSSYAPAPGPLTGGSCALGALENSGNFTLLLDLIQASSESSLLQGLLSSSSEQATIFAPTDAGIEATLKKENVTPDDLLSDATQLTNIIEYHISPSTLAPADLQNGYSFNTLYSVNGVAESVAISGNGLSATVQGSASSAPIISQESVCNFIIYPIDGLLLSNA